MGDNGRVRFLSLEWMAALASAATIDAPGPSLAIHQRVTGGPQGDVEYTLRLDHGAVRVEPGPGWADVEIVEDYATAAAISQGRLSPAAAFAAGRLRVGGSIGLLVTHQEALAALGGRMADLAGATAY